jgi:hypothetical protein
MNQREEERGYAAGLEAGRKVPEGWRLVELSTLQRAADSLGSFCSDHGWSDSDMETLDAVLALIAAAPEYKHD